jgi:hypothetical protein
MPKYLNSSETPLFHKGSTLYGLYQAKEAIRQSDRVLVVEGYLDAIALAQFGVAYSVATLGTALTVEHVRAYRAIPKTSSPCSMATMQVSKRRRVVSKFSSKPACSGARRFCPKGEDPDTFIRAKGKAALEAILDRAVPLADFYFSWLEGRHGKAWKERAKSPAKSAGCWRKLPIRSRSIYWRAEPWMYWVFARNFCAGRQAPLLDLGPTPSATRPLSPSNGDNRDDVAERTLISLMLRMPALLEQLARDGEARQWFSAKWRQIVDEVIARGKN